MSLYRPSLVLLVTRKAFFTYQSMSAFYIIKLYEVCITSRSVRVSLLSFQEMRCEAVWISPSPRSYSSTVRQGCNGPPNPAIRLFLSKATGIKSNHMQCEIITSRYKTRNFPFQHNDGCPRTIVADPRSLSKNSLRSAPDFISLISVDWDRFSLIGYKTRSR